MSQLNRDRERREHQRFKAVEGAVVLAATNFGNVVNISKGGMAVQYINWDNAKGDQGLLDVVLKGDIVLKDFPFFVIPDSEMYDMGQSRMMVMKRRRIQFGSLTVAQEVQLSHYIEHHALAEA